MRSEALALGVSSQFKNDDHDDEDLEEDVEEHCLSAAQLLRKHRATEFNEEDFEEDYY